MARTNNLTNFLNDVATAIKQKTGNSTPIPASDFDTEILRIETVGTYQTKQLTVTTNGNYVVTPDTGYDAISDINISVSVSPILQNKTITQNGSYTADQNYDGLGTVIVNVPGSTINNQDKTITQNGSYTADQGYTGLGTVTVNVPSGSGDVKLFDTVEHMQADSTAQEGDLAIIYRDATQPVQEDSEFSSCIFPNTVVLDEAFSGNIYGSFRSTGGGFFDGMVDMSSSGFRFDGFGDKMIRVEYTSQDGITYTRTDGGEELQEFGTTIKWESGGNPFNSVIGNFMKIGGKHFDGLYEYGTGTDIDISCLGIKFSDLYPTYNQNVLYQYNSNLTDLVRLNADDIAYSEIPIVFKIQAESSLYYGQTLYKPIEGYSPLSGTNVTIGQMIENNTNYLIAYMTNSPADKTLLHYTGSGFENINILTNEWQSFTVNSSAYYYKILATIDPTEWVANYKYSLFSMGESGTIRPKTFVKTGSTATMTSGDYSVVPTYGTSTRYFYAPTQLTLSSSDQLSPDKIGYGKNGVVTGDGSIYQNLDADYLLPNIFGFQRLYNGTEKIYGVLNDAISCVSDTNKITYLKQSTNGKILYGKVQKQKQLPYLDYTGRNIYFSTDKTRYVARYDNGTTQLYGIFDTTDTLLQSIPAVSVCQQNNIIYYITSTELHSIDIMTLTDTKIANITIYNDSSGTPVGYINNLRGYCLIYSRISYSSNCYVYDTIHDNFATMYEMVQSRYDDQIDTILDTGDNLYFKWRTSSGGNDNMKQLNFATGTITTLYTNSGKSGNYGSFDGYVSAVEIDNKVYTNGNGYGYENGVCYQFSKSTSSITTGTVYVNGNDATWYKFCRTTDGTFYIGYSENTITKIGKPTITMSGNDMNITVSMIDCLGSLPSINNDVNDFIFNTYVDNKNIGLVSWSNNNELTFEIHKHCYLYAVCKLYNTTIDATDYDAACINTYTNTSYETAYGKRANVIEIGGSN